MQIFSIPVDLIPDLIFCNKVFPRSSILAYKLLKFREIKLNPLELKTLHFLPGCNRSLLRGPRFKPISSESNNSNSKQELVFCTDDYKLTEK